MRAAAAKGRDHDSRSSNHWNKGMHRMTQATTQRRTVRLYAGIAKAVTPAVLIAGLLILAVYHFRGVLQITQAQDDLFRGTYAFSQDQLEMDFQRDGGLDRPVVLYNRFELMSYSDWDSTISIDGHEQELWNNFHGYSLDSTKHQLFASTSGYGWQLTEVVTLVDNHTVTVTYQFTARHVGVAEPHQVVLHIYHQHNGNQNILAGQNALWYYPTITGTTFSAEELPIEAQNPAHAPLPNQTYTAYPTGTTTLQVSGPALSSTPLTLRNYGNGLTPDGKTEAWAATLVSEYTISEPPVDTLITLGTETISYASLAPNAGTPVVLPLPQQ